MPPRKKTAAEKIPSRGTARMQELGMKRVTVWLDSHELVLVAAAAAGDKKRLATWIREKAYHAAQAAAEERVRTQRRDARGD